MADNRLEATAPPPPRHTRTTPWRFRDPAYSWAKGLVGRERCGGRGSDGGPVGAAGSHPPAPDVLGVVGEAARSPERGGRNSEARSKLGAQGPDSGAKFGATGAGLKQMLMVLGQSVAPLLIHTRTHPPDASLCNPSHSRASQGRGARGTRPLDTSDISRRLPHASLHHLWGRLRGDVSFIQGRIPPVL